MASTKSARAVEQARRWLFDGALPLWLERGVDAPGLFAEALDFQARPLDARPRRTMVQARQLFVFAEAHRAGWSETLPLDRWLDGFAQRCRLPSGGWAHALHPDGSVVDPRPDLYDHAFVLLALCAVYRATGEPRAKTLAIDTLAWLDANMREPSDGWAEALPPVLPRRANPHMHLLEAMLSWRDAGWAEAEPPIADLLNLFSRRFFDAEAGLLTEFFDRDWRRAAGEPGEVIEPGHHFEWTWLLHAAGGCDEAASRLYAAAQRCGRDKDGFAIDQCDRSGGQTRRSRRTWPQTEMIKAQLAMGELQAAAAHFGRVDETYLATDVPGLWIDQFDAEGRPVSADVPASTLYHVALAIRELLAAPL